MSKKKNTCNGSIMLFFMKKGADYEMSALTGDYEVDSPTQKLDFTQEEEEGDHTQTDMLSQPLLTTPPVKDEMHSPVKSAKKAIAGDGRTKTIYKRAKMVVDKEES